MKWWIWAPVGAVAAFVAFGAMQSSTPEGKERSRQRDAISMCWDNQGKRSNDPGTARFIAGACERMEAEFVTRWGRKP